MTNRILFKNHIICSTIVVLCIFWIGNTSVFAQISTPTGFKIQAYDSHIDLVWNTNPEPHLLGYRIYRKHQDESEFQLLKYLGKSVRDYIDFVGRQDDTFEYRIVAVANDQTESMPTDVLHAQCFEMTDIELLTMVQQYTFNYFWDFAHPVSGLARERNTTSTVTIGGTGFGIMAILVGIEREFISHQEGLERINKIVDFLYTADRFHGVWPHWMNGATGETIPFSSDDNGGDLVETAFLVQGLLTARQFFSSEDELYNKITTLWEEVEWDWYRQNNQDKLYWHWSPNFAWQKNHAIVGFNEAHIIYILAIASETHGVPAGLYHSGWAGNNYKNSGTFFGHRLEVGSYRGGPLFFSHYSYLGFDPRNKKDQYTNYFIRNRNHTLINQAYCVDNPKNFEGYGEYEWGLTASDDPFGYLAHEPSSNRDNGTISPTAAISSIPYTPEISIKALKHFYRELGAQLWGKYGFYDAFNKTEDWYASSYLAIDQGPIIGMIENYRSQLLWDHFMQNEEIDIALDKIGFEYDSTTVSTTENIGNTNEITLFPTIVLGELNLEIKGNDTWNWNIFDLKGKLLNKGTTQGLGTIDLGHYAKGIYFIHFNNDKKHIYKKFIKL